MTTSQRKVLRSSVHWISWQSATERDSEARLSQLCRWVLDADAAGLAYGLLMPGQRVEPARGEAHRRHCRTRGCLRRNIRG